MHESPSPNEANDIYEVTLNDGVWLPSKSKKFRGTYIVEEIDTVSLCVTHIKFRVSNTDIVTRIISSYDSEGKHLHIPQDITNSHRFELAVNAQEIESFNENGESVFSLKFNINPVRLSDATKSEESSKTIAEPDSTNLSDL